MIEKFISWLSDNLNRLNLDDKLTNYIEGFILIIILLLILIVTDFISRRIIVNAIKTYVKKSKNEYDDILLENKVFNRLAHIIPAVIIFYSIDNIFDLPDLVNFIRLVVKLYLVANILLFIDSLISSLHKIYQRFPISTEKPVTGYVQVLKIFIYAIGLILIISILTGKEPYALLAGLGAIAAVLLLVFKDSILGLVASIQLSANNMVRPGDWIEMPSRNADGTVLEITLHTVKVQNWDRTISSFPTYALVSESFQNWKGMEESGGRRIKRAVNIDMKSVHFLSPEEINELKKIELLRGYIEMRQEEIKKFNEEKKIDTSTPVNGRRMTNLGTFRKYMEVYLNTHPRIHKDMTLIVRHMRPSETGIPMEIYAFSKEQGWVQYEAVQSDIFDHMLSVIPYFNLRVFQDPSGYDISEAVEFIKKQ